MSDDTLTNLRALLAEYSIRDADTIELTDTLGSYGIDSLEHIQLILDVEELFEIVIPEDDGPLIITVAGLYDAILSAQDRAANFQPASSIDSGLRPHLNRISA